MNIFKLFMYAIHRYLNLRFLPNSILQYLFNTGPRIVGMLSALIMMFVACFFWLRICFFEKPQWLVNFPLSLLIFILVSIAIAQFVAVLFNSVLSHVILGCLLLISALIWAILSKFLLIYELPLNFLETYAVLIVICAMSGRVLIYHAKQQIDTKKNEGY